MSLSAGDDDVLILHNARCSKSRAALALLEQSGVPFRVRSYLDQPLSRAELADLRRRLDLPPAEWVRRSQPEYAAAGLGPAAGEDELLDAIARAPVLLERPIVVRGRRAVVARQPGALERLLEDGAGS